MPDAPRVLIALDDALEAEQIGSLLEQEGATVEIAAGPREAQRALARGPDASGQAFACVLSEDAWGSSKLLAQALAQEPAPAVVLITGFGTVQDALTALREGARACLPRPVSREQVQHAVLRAIEEHQRAQDYERLKVARESRPELTSLGGRDPRMRAVLAQAEAVSDTRATVLIEGESGTGKSQLARAIHERSTRRAAPFVTLNCGALPPQLQESELFGHARGAFTGAVKDKPGLIEAAHGGTLFLDEISSAPPDLQVKLLRVIQERAFERVGEARTRTVDVRWMAASNRALSEEVAAQRFREDLYWRLNVVHLELPALRARADDIPRLALVFLERFRAEYHKPRIGFSAAALAAMVEHAWPGNIRQLENAIERGVLLARGAEIEPADLGLFVASAPEPAQWFKNGQTLRELLAGPERHILEQALARHQGNRERTAQALGINRSTLFHKMRRHGLLEGGLPGPAGRGTQDARGNPA